MCCYYCTPTVKPTHQTITHQPNPQISYTNMFQKFVRIKHANKTTWGGGGGRLDLKLNSQHFCFRFFERSWWRTRWSYVIFHLSPSLSPHCTSLPVLLSPSLSLSLSPSLWSLSPFFLLSSSQTLSPSLSLFPSIPTLTLCPPSLHSLSLILFLFFSLTWLKWVVSKPPSMKRMFSHRSWLTSSHASTAMKSIMSLLYENKS